MSKRMENRRTNLKRLIDTHGGPKAVAERVGYKSASYLVQMTGPQAFADPDNAKPVTEDTARKIEAAFGLPEGSLDWPPEVSTPAPTPAPARAAAAPQAATPEAAARDAQIVQMLAAVWSEDMITLPVVKFGQIAAYAISEAAETGHVPSPDTLRRLVHLLK